MSEQVKKTAVGERSENLHLNTDSPENRGQLLESDIEKYLSSKEKVSARDRWDFEVYLNEKRQRDLVPAAELNRPSKLDRRTILKVVTGTAVAGEAAALGYGWVTSGTAPPTSR